VAGEKYDLYFGATRVGVVTQSGPRFPYQCGAIEFESGFTTAITSEPSRIARLVAEGKAGTRTPDREHAASDSRVPTDIAGYQQSAASLEWRLVDHGECALPIVCPLFNTDGTIAWRWNCSSGYSVTESNDQITFQPRMDRDPGRAARQTMFLAIVAGLVFLLLYFAAGTWIVYTQPTNWGANAEVSFFAAWVFPSGFLVVCSVLSFAGALKLWRTCNIPLVVARSGAVAFGQRQLTRAGEARCVRLDRRADWIKPESDPAYLSRSVHIYLERTNGTFTELPPPTFSSLSEWELGSVLAHELAVILEVSLSTEPPPPVTAARLRQANRLAGCFFLQLIAIGLPNYLLGAGVLILGDDLDPRMRWGVGGAFALAGAVFTGVGWLCGRRGSLWGYVGLLALLAAMLAALRLTAG